MPAPKTVIYPDSLYFNALLLAMLHSRGVVLRSVPMRGGIESLVAWFRVGRTL